MGGYVTASVDVDVDDLLDDADEAREKLEKIWLLRREGKQYDRELDQLIYYVLGKAI